MGCSGSKEISEAQQVNAQIESQIKRDKISLRYLSISLSSNSKKKKKTLLFSSLNLL
jgi:hypothetical protein